MIKEELLKERILQQFKSVRQFCIDADIPYSTLATAFDKGIEHMTYKTVLKICDILTLNPIDFTPIEEVKDVSSKYLNNKLTSKYLNLNSAGRKKLLEYLDDISSLHKYVN